VYVKFAEETKPLFVDFQVPVLVDLFVRAWQRAEVHGRYTCELRLGCYRRSDPGDGAGRRAR
jgi:hypothetical protein